MKLDLTKPIRFRSDGTERAYVGPVPDGTHVFAYRDDGGAWIPQRSISDVTADVMYENVPERTERWVNLYPDFSGYAIHETKERANDRAAPRRTGLIKVTYEGDTPVAVELVKD